MHASASKSTGLTTTQWLICLIASIGFAFDIYELLMLPLIIRPAFTLGGTGGGTAFTLEQLRTITASGIAASPVGQVLVERSLLGWKEIEYEVMRDAGDTCITICNMENFDPMGVHTGDSIVVAPSQTLSDQEYQMLRSAALLIIRALGSTLERKENCSTKVTGGVTSHQ